MATIQVRDVPDEVHQAYRRRAADAGMSLQEYLRAELIRGAGRRTPREVMADIEERLRVDGDDAYLHGSSAALVRSERDVR